MKWLLISSLVIFCLFTACQKKGNSYGIIPHITFVSVTPDSVKAGTSEDSLKIIFHFTDGDADLGNSATSGNKDIYLIDSRDTNQVQGFFFPYIDPSLKDPDKGLDGNCLFSLSSAFINFRDSVHQKTGDTLHYIIYIKDVAGHVSNRITTPDIYLRP